MGRRKIEIQPILHERNRAVTFLKRKNGLFKKAYELGVLCSVDVAVIIFEERPSHHVKLYQYCSTDIQDMVQRHMRFEGEKDTRGPTDFSGSAAKQMDDTGEGDDDDGDDDDDNAGVRGPSKRRPDGRLKPPSTMGMAGGPDMSYPRIAMPTQPPMPISGLQTTQSSGLPISSDREIMHGGGTPSMSKRPKFEHPPHSRSSSDDPGSSAYFPSSSNYRQQSYHQPQTGPQYGNYFPVGGSQTSPPSSFIPLQPEYSGRGTAPPARTGSGAGSTGAGAGAGAGGAPSGGGGGGHYGPRQQYDPSLYPTTSIIRHPHQQQHPGGPGGNEMFSVYQLEADGQRQAAAAAAQGQFGMEWPVHSAASSAPPTGSSAGPPSSVSNTSNGAPSSASGESNWLDFLSGNSANASATGPGGGGGGGGGGGAHTSHPNISSEAARNSLSWERGHEVADIFPGTSSTGSGGGGGSEGRPSSGRSGGVTSPMSAGGTNKRGRVVVESTHDKDDNSKQGASLPSWKRGRDGSSR